MRFAIFMLLILSASMNAIADSADADSFDAYDLSFISKGAAIGDSYAAGIGAGNELDWGCSRYDGSYANLVALQVGDNSRTLDFTFTACSGAVIDGVRKQADTLSTGQQFVIVSAGGNDANLVGILNACVYRFKPFFLDSTSCEQVLANSEAVMRSSNFASNVDGLIQRVMTKLAPGGNIYYVGYAKFFDTTDASCDKVSWRLWSLLSAVEYLTQDRRQKMNALVDVMNSVLQAAVNRAGSQVHFVNYDQYVSLTGGTYCQPGQDESAGNSANRQDLFFYKMKTVDRPDPPYEPKIDLRRRQSSSNDQESFTPLNGTLGAMFGALVEEFIQSNDSATLFDANANNDLEAEVVEEEQSIKARSLPALHQRSLPSGTKSIIINASSSATSKYNAAQAVDTSFANVAQISSAASKPSTTGIRSIVRLMPNLDAFSRSTGTSLGSGYSLVRQHLSSDTSSGPVRSSTSVPLLDSVASNVIANSRFTQAASGGPSKGLRSSPSSASRSTLPSHSRVLYSLRSRETKPSRSSGFVANTASVQEATTSGSSQAIQLLDNKFSNGSTGGTMVANSTHVLLANGQIVEKIAIRRLFLSDKTCRVFHPTQGGHILIANVILHQMAAVNAQSHGIADFPSMGFEMSGRIGPNIGGAACNAMSSDTWTNRSAMITAVDSFCADPHNTRGAGGALNSLTYGNNSLDYMNISIAWPETANISQHTCAAALDVVTDGCGASNNPGNWKHGGTIAYGSESVNATLTIEPLTIRQPFDRGKGRGQQCMDPALARRFIDQATLQSNVNDFCALHAWNENGIARPGHHINSTYNQGTFDEVILKAAWPMLERHQYQIFRQECQYYMGVLTNGCNLPGPENPMNWKSGGTMTDGNGITYSITPINLREMPKRPLGLCTATRYWWGYGFQINGKGWASGDHGSNLLTQLRGCNDNIGYWTFDYNLHGGGLWEWSASGQVRSLLISDHCISKAVNTAAGDNYDPGQNSTC